MKKETDTDGTLSNIDKDIHAMVCWLINDNPGVASINSSSQDSHIPNKKDFDEGIESIINDYISLRESHNRRHYDLPPLDLNFSNKFVEKNKEFLYKLYCAGVRSGKKHVLMTIKPWKKINGMKSVKELVANLE